MADRSIAPEGASRPASSDISAPWIRDREAVPNLRARLEAHGLQLVINANTDGEVYDLYAVDNGLVVCTSAWDQRVDAIHTKDLLDMLDQIEKHGAPWWRKPHDDEPADKRANRIAAVRDLTADEARDGLHAETVREIRREYPGADEREVKLRVAIRESIGMTAHEEDETYRRIAEALS